MSKLQRIYACCCAFALSFMVSSTTHVYAAATTGDAVSDIMNDARFQGAISSIEWLTGQIDRWFIMVITLTAFFIIASAMLKNVSAGAYCANHKFWDRVAEAHERADALNLAGIKDYFTGKQFMQTTRGGLKDMILSHIPSVKAWTDFDDADIEPKAYFAKAIPQMLVCIIIGVFIYNGYYRDTASMVGSFGSEILNRVFASVDPVSFVDKLTETTKKPDNIFKNDQTLQGQDAYAISEQIYKVILSNSKGLTSEEAKEAVMRDSETWAWNLVTNSNMTKTFYGDSRKYDFQASNVKVVAVKQMPSGYSGTFANPTVTNIKEDTDDEYALTAYQNIDLTASEYMEDGYTYIYLSCVMKGSAKDVSKEGETSLTPTSGNWNAGKVSALTKTVTDYHTSSKDGSSSVYGTNNLQIKSLVSTSELTAKVQEYCTESGLTLDSASVSVESWSGYNAGSGQNPCIKFNDVPLGTSITCTAGVTFQAKSNTATDGGAEYETMRLEVPVQFILGSN